MDQLRSLNPQYKIDIIPGNTETCTLRLPRNYINTFIDSKDSVYNYHTDVFFSNRTTVEVPQKEVIEKPVVTSRHHKTSAYHKSKKSKLHSKHKSSVSREKKKSKTHKKKGSSKKRSRSRR
jgi:hypothetical protein